VSYVENGVDPLAPICGRGDGSKDLYNLLAQSEEPQCKEMLEKLCGSEKVSITASVVATVSADDVALYLDQSNALNIQLREDTCEAVVTALTDAFSDSGASVQSTSSEITFECVATVEAQSRRRRLGGAEASLKVTTTASSLQTFSPEEAGEFKADIVSAQGDISTALMTSTGSVPGVAVDLNQVIDFEASTENPVADPSPNTGDSDDGLSTGVAVGIALSCVAAVAIAAAGVVYVVQRKSEVLKPQDSMKVPKATKNNSFKLSKTHGVDNDYDKDL